MEFEKLFEKYLAGDCSEEEKAYIEQEMERARIVNETMLGKTSVAFKPADDDIFKRAQKRFNTGLMWRIIGITFGVLLLSACITLSIIFVPAIQGARERLDISAQEATRIAQEYVFCLAKENYNYAGSADGLIIKHRDRDLEMRSPRDNSVYVYDFEIVAAGIEYEVSVDSQSGSAIVTDVDFD